MRRRKKKMGTMDKILIIIAVFLFVFTVTMILIYIKTGGTPDELIRSVFLALTGELGVMGWIKSSKERKRERKYELYDKLYERLLREENENETD